MKKTNRKTSFWVDEDFKRLVKGFAATKGEQIIPLTKRMSDAANKDFEELIRYRDKIKKQ